MKNILVILSRSDERHDIYSALVGAIEQVGNQIDEEVNLIRSEDIRYSDGNIQQQIINADIVIVDVSGSPPDVMYELGFSHGQGKPIILISENFNKPTLYDLKNEYQLLFDRSRLKHTLLPSLIPRVIESIQYPSRFTLFAKQQPENNVPRKPTVFVSYSHADSKVLERLQIHLKPLHRDNIIEYWDDSQIKAGERWINEIQLALDRARIAILLISADFLASNFIVDNELPPLLKAAEGKGTTILPVILKPCSFMRNPSLSVFQAVNDPARPLLGLSSVEQEEIYERIAERIENEFNIS